MPGAAFGGRCIMKATGTRHMTTTAKIATTSRNARAEACCSIIIAMRMYAWRVACAALTPSPRRVAEMPSTMARKRGLPFCMLAERYTCRVCVVRVTMVLTSAIPMLPPTFRTKFIMLET